MTKKKKAKPKTPSTKTAQQAMWSKMLKSFSERKP